jgi:hypothetical protein
MTLDPATIWFSQTTIHHTFSKGPEGSSRDAPQTIEQVWPRSHHGNIRCVEQVWPHTHHSGSIHCVTYRGVMLPYSSLWIGSGQSHWLHDGEAEVHGGD